MRPAKAFLLAAIFYCHPARDLFLVFNDRYATFFCDSSKKRSEFWQRFFSFGRLEWFRPAGTLLGLNVGHKFERLPAPALDH